MNPIAWMLMGGTVGMIIGAIVTLVFVRESLIAYHQDMENHRYAAMEMSKMLGQARRENEQLTEQVNILLMINEPDSADFWKREG